MPLLYLSTSPMWGHSGEQTKFVSILLSVKFSVIGVTLFFLIYFGPVFVSPSRWHVTFIDEFYGVLSAVLWSRLE